VEKRTVVVMVVDDDEHEAGVVLDVDEVMGAGEKM
jgi:hypothetical protein